MDYGDDAPTINYASYVGQSTLRGDLYQFLTILIIQFYSSAFTKTKLYRNVPKAENVWHILKTFWTSNSTRKPIFGNKLVK